MSQALILFRSTNLSKDGSRLVYNVPSGISLKNKEVALQAFSFYNSFFNISSDLDNNRVTLVFPRFTSANTNTTQSFVWTIADGFYSFNDLNLALQQFMLSQKLYLFNQTTGKYMYFYSIFQNTVRYAVQLQTNYLPTLEQATALGFAVPSGSPLALNPALSGGTPQTKLSAPYVTFRPNFGRLIGFDQTTSVPSAVLSKNSDTYDPNPANTSLSTTTPYINPIDCILLRCNIANNVNSIPNDLLSVTPISSQYGAITQYTAPFPLYIPCAQTAVTAIEITMYDQNLNIIKQRDAEITLVLSIRDAPTAANNFKQ